MIGNISATGNVSANDLIAYNYVSTGSVYAATIGNSGATITGTTGTFSGNITAGNVIANLYGTQYGNTVGTTATYSGNITANYFVGNGSALTGLTYNNVGNIYGSSSNVSVVAGSYTWVFDNTGNLTIPVNGDLVFNTGTTLGSVAGSNGNITVNPDGTGQFVVTTITPAWFGNNVTVLGNLKVNGVNINGGFASVNAPATVNQLLTPANADSWSQVTSGNITLPYGNSLPGGTTMSFSNHGGSVYYILTKDPNNEFIYNGNNPYTTSNRNLQLAPGESVTLMTRGTVEWDIVNGGNKYQTGPIIISGTQTISPTYMNGVLEINGSGTYTLPNPTTYRGQITLWLNTASTITFTTPAGSIYVTYSGTTSGTGTATVTLGNNNTSLFELMSDGVNWAIWGVKTA
jgi:hypothetical protein